MRLIFSIYVLLHIHLSFVCASTFGKTEIGFKENKGQIVDQFQNPRPDVLFLLADGNFKLQLKKNGFSYELSESQALERTQKNEYISTRYKNDFENDSIVIKTHRIDIDLIGCNSNPKVIGHNAYNSYDNYYLAHLGKDGATNVKTYTKVVYEEIYKGIDLVFYLVDGRMKYDFIVKHKANHKQIKLLVKGANKYIDEKGNLIHTTSLGSITENTPYTFQENTNNNSIESNYLLEKEMLSFEIGKYDKSKTLIIDPTIAWATYYGGSSSQAFLSITTDKIGYTYSSGFTSSNTNIATSGAYQQSIATPSDVLIVKFDFNGNRAWGTYLGGNGADAARSICFQNDKVFVTGSTLSLNFPTTSGVYQTVPTANTSIKSFVTAFNSNGSLIWSTYCAGSATITGLGITTDNSSNVIVVGATSSNTDISTIGAYQQNKSLANDAFVIKFDSTGNRIWGSYYGGGVQDEALSVATNSNNEIFFGGLTSSQNLPSDIAYGGGNFDGFITKFDANGNRLWGTYVGGNQQDLIKNLIVDKLNNIYVIGDSESSSRIATVGSFQETYSGQRDAFIIKFDSLNTIEWGTYVGGQLTDFGEAIALDKNNNIIIGGKTESLTNIATTDAFQSTLIGPAQLGANGSNWGDAYFMKFSPTGSRIWGTYYGGNFEDIVKGIVCDNLGGIYGAGSTVSTSGIATSGAHQTTKPSSTQFIDCFLIKIDDLAAQPSVISNNVNINYTNCNNAILQWSNGNGSNRLVVIKQGAAVSSLPSNATVYNANNTFGFGDDLGSGNYIVYNGNSNSVTVNGLVAGNTYHVAIFEYNGIQGSNNYLTSNYATFSFTVPDNIIILPTVNNVSCSSNNDGSIQLSVSGGTPPYEYIWNNNATTNQINNLASGTYSVTVNDSAGCSLTTSFFINQAATFSITTQTTDVDCFGGNDGKVIVNINGGAAPFSYLWSNGDTTTILTSVAGNYTVTVTDANNCSATSNATINEPLPISLNVSKNNVTCENGNDGSITIIVSGGKSPYQYTWSNGQVNTFIINDIAAGNYAVTVIDDNGCIIDTSFTINEQSNISITTIPENETCTGKNNGRVKALVNGNYPPFTFEWSNGTILDNISNLEVGSYTVTVTDSLGCKKSNTVNIGNGIVLSIDYNVTKPTCEADNNGAIIATATGGNAPYIYFWSNGDSLNAIVNINQGWYNLTVTDLNDCVITDSIFLEAINGEECFDTLVNPFVIYDVFSPNNDGRNDLWVIDGLDNYPDNEVQIFNRWGSEVYYMKNYNNTWNGSNQKGEPLPSATYYYILKLNDAEERVFSGHVTIIR